MGTQRLHLSPLKDGRSTVYDLIRMRLLGSVKIGKSRRIPAEACRALVVRLAEDQLT